MSESEKEDNQELERFKIKVDLFKFFLGTLAVSLISIGINWQIQEKKLEFEIQSRESDYIGKFLAHGLDKELENRRDFAAYFVRLSPSEESRGRWGQYLIFVEELIGKAKEAEKEISEKDVELKIIANKVALAEKKENESRKKLFEAKEADRKKLEQQVSLLSKDAKESRKLLQQIQGKIANTRQDLASIRSKPIETEPQDLVVVGNISKKSKEKGFWHWTIFIRAPETLLAQVEQVEYKLHSTFDDPIKIVNQRGNGRYAFPYNATGWGEFTVQVKIYYKNGTYQTLSHFLEFKE